MKRTKPTPEMQRLYAEIMILGMLVNENTEYCVFVSYSGHIYGVDIKICESKEQYNTEIAQTSFYTGLKEAGFYDEIQTKESRNIIWLTEKRNLLLNILETGNIPYGMMDEVIEQHVGYFF